MNAEEHMQNDFYALFELPVSATQQEIRKQFRKLSKQYHPDRNVSVSASEAAACSKKYELINFAYSILVDPVLRKEYDQLYFIERQIKGHHQLKGAFDDYLSREASMGSGAAGSAAPNAAPTVDRSVELSTKELETAFVEKQQRFINSDRYRQLSSKTITELVGEMQLTRDEQIDSAFRVKNVDDIHNQFTNIRSTQEERNEIVLHREPIAASIDTIQSAGLHSGSFGSPFADANGTDDDLSGIGSGYTSLHQSTVIQVPQSSINTYSVKKDYKRESEKYERFSDQIPELLARSDPLVQHREKHSAILQNVLNGNLER